MFVTRHRTNSCVSISIYATENFVNEKCAGDETGQENVVVVTWMIA